MSQQENAVITGRQYSELEHSTSLTRRGRILRKKVYVETLVEMGVKPIELLRQGLFRRKQNVHQFLLGIGLDREERVRLQKDSNPRITEIIDELKAHAKRHGKFKGSGQPFFTDSLCHRVDELFHICELRYVEVSPYLDCSPASLKSAMHRWRATGQ